MKTKTWRTASRSFLVVGSLLVASAAVVPSATAAPRWLRLSWTQSPSTTVTIAWSDDSDGASQAEIRLPGGTATATAGTSEDTQSGTLGVTYHATFTGLTPSTAYEYRVQSAGSWSTWYTTRTAPTPGSCEPFTFVSVGDGRGQEIPVLGYTQSQQWPGVMSLIAAENPLFVIHSGDYVYDGDVEEQWETELDDLMTISALSPFLLSQGNHDDGPGEGPTANYNKLFVYSTSNPDSTEDYYSLVMGNVQIICLSTHSFSIEDQITWMDAELTAQQGTVDWRVVFFHVPIWSSGAHGSNEDDTPRASLMLPVLESHGVDLVINGHDHDYERFHPSVGGHGSGNRVVTPLPQDGGTRGVASGVIYYVTGGAGALVNPLFTATETGSAQSSNHLHYLVLEANGDTLSVTARDLGSQSFGAPSHQGELDAIHLEKATTVCNPVPGPDAGVPDAGAPDAAVGEDAAADSGAQPDDAGAEADAGPEPGPDSGGETPSAGDSGCGCRTGSTSAPPWLLLLVLGLWVRWRRRRAG